MELHKDYRKYYVVVRNSSDNTYDVFYKATSPKPYLEFRANFETEKEAYDNIEEIARQETQGASDTMANFITWMKQNK